MWCPDGYITIGSIYSQFCWDEDLISTALDKRSHISDGSALYSELDFVERDAFSTWMIVGFLDIFRSDVRACLFSGEIVNFEKFALSSSMPQIDGRIAIENFPYCKFPDKYAERKSIADIVFHIIEPKYGLIKTDCEFNGLGPLHGASLCIKDECIPVKIEDLPKWLLEQLETRSELEIVEKFDASISEKIVTAFESGKVETKTEAKRIFGRDMKTEVWRSHWLQAVAIKPSLARPGPRRGRNTG